MKKSPPKALSSHLFFSLRPFETRDVERMMESQQNMYDSDAQTRRSVMGRVVLERSQSQGQAGETPLAVECDENAHQVRVHVGKISYGWFVDTPSNRQAV